MQGCQNPMWLLRGAASVATISLLAATLATAQTTGDHSTRVVETTPEGEIVYSTEGSFVSQPGNYCSPYGSDFVPSLQSHLRARYNTRSYGQVRGNLDLGTMRVFDAFDGDDVWFIDGQVTMNDESKVGYNLGVGYRFMTLPLLPFSDDQAKIAGISLWSDGTTTVNDNFMSQIGVSAEYLGDNWDFRWNTYAALSGTESGEFRATGEFSYAGEFLSQETRAGTDEALSVNEFELARRMGNRDLWIFGGGYGMYGDTVDTEGFKIGTRGYLTPDLLVQFSVNDDEVFGTNSVASVTWFIGRTRDPSYCSPSLAARMREPVIRNDYVAVKQDSITGGIPVIGDIDGDGENEPIRVVHVDSTAAAGGDGSFENPLNMMSGIEGTGASPAIVLVHSGSSFTDDPAVLLDGQRLLGEGNDIEHMVTTADFGSVVLPESAPGARSGAIPTINNSGAIDGITLAESTIEVSNLAIDGGTRGVVAPNGSLAVNINNVSIANTTGDGIVLTPASETVDGDLQVRFQLQLSDLTFDNVGGNDIDIDAASPEGPGVPVIESIAISDVTSTNGQGVGINLANNVSAATITDYSNDMGTGPSAIALTSNEGSVNITDAEISNQTGMGISVVNSDGSHTFADVEITDTDGAALHVNGGETDIMFTGFIDQNSAGEVLLVEGGHSGSLDFFEMVTDDGVINATSGDGLVFNDADGTYTFLDTVTIDGTTQGIDVTNDSEGSLTFLDATITDTTGTSVHFAGGSASMNFTGLVTQSNAATTLFVEAEHTGTLTFNEAEADTGVINATNGDGLVFNNADGGYIFNHEVLLDGSGNGADTAIDISNDSDGTFTFDDGRIIDPTGAAISVDGGSSVFTFTGEISQNNNVETISVSGGHDGAMTFLSADSTTNVITATNGTGLQFNDADGDYGFVGSVELDGSAVAADTGIDILNDSDGTFTFSETTIVDPTGTAFNVVGGSADVDYTGTIEQSNNATTVSVAGGHDGTLTFVGDPSSSDVVTATNGDGLQFNNADGTYRFNSGVSLNGGDAGVDIENGSSGTFSFDNDSEITNPTGDAFVIADSDANVDYNGTITDNTGRAVRIENNSGGTVTFDGEVTNTDTGILVQNNTGGSFSFGGGSDLDTGANDAVTLNNNTNTTISFSSLDIDTTTGDGLVATNSEGVQVLGLNNSITTTTGTGLNMNNVEVGAAGISLDSVSSNGASNGIVMNDVTGGAVTIGFGASSQGEGGTIQNSTGAGIVLNNVEDITFNFIEVTGSGGNGIAMTNDDATQSNVEINDSVIRGSAGQGFSLDSNGSGVVRLALNDNTFDTNTDESIFLDINNNSSTTNITVDNNNVDNSTSNNSALLLVADGAAGKTVNVLLQDNIFSNDDPTASTVDLLADGNVTMNTTVLDNSFVNSDATPGPSFTATTDDGSALLRLDLNGNTAASGGVPADDDYFLTNNAGTFRVEDLANVDTNNTGEILQTGVIANDPGNIPLPQQP